MRTFSALLLAAAAELCLCCAVPTAARAQFGPFANPQAYFPTSTAAPESCPGPAPLFPSLPPPAAPSQPQPPAEQPQQNQQPQTPQQPQAANPAAPETTPAAAGAETGDAFTAPAEGEGEAEAAAASGGEAGGGGPSLAAAAPMLGRADFNNRFNLFDNMSAYTTNRVWVAYQYLDHFQTGIGIDPASPAVTRSFAARRDESLDRVGVEVMPFGNCGFESRFSIAFQTQYIASNGTDNSADAWGTPEIIAKYALIQSNCCALSALFGVEPEISTGLYELHEKATRIMPGLLFYDAITCRLFVQGGLDFSLAEHAPNTFDWALSAGYWLYQADCMALTCPAPGCRPCIVGIIPQVEFLGTEVMSKDTSDPYDIPADPTMFGSALAPYREPRNVVDFTGGLRILFGTGFSFSVGGSVPLTGGQVRRSEFLTALGYYF